MKLVNSNPNFSGTDIFLSNAGNPCHFVTNLVAGRDKSHKKFAC